MLNYSDYTNIGLTEREAQILLKKYGKNKLEEKKKPSVVFMFLSQFKDVLVIILLVSTVISLLMGEIVESFAILLVVLMNGFFGFFQEYKTEKTLEALKKLSAPYCRVIRGGVRKKIKSEDVVPGDIVVIEAGDRVPADCILANASMISVDESMLTGESEPVRKKGAINAGECRNMKEIASKFSNGSLRETESLVFMGTLLLTGNAVGMTLSTGMDTEMGKIAKMLEDVNIEDNTLQKKMNKLGKILAIVCVGICAVVTLLGIWRGEDVFDMLLSGISLAVASIPESLPAVVMVSLAVGVQRMFKRNALIKKLSAVETIGMADTICTDKTGTLTENKMTLKKIYFYDREIEFEKDSGRELTKCCLGNKCDKTKISLEKISDETKFFYISILCNNSDGISGDSYEKALVEAAIKASFDVGNIRESHLRLTETPFDPDKRYMTVSVVFADGKYLLIKGAPEVVLAKSENISVGGRIMPVNEVIRRRITNVNNTLASNALRVLAFAYRKLEGDPNSIGADEMMKGLTFVGLAAVMDPPRKDVSNAIHNCKKAGIKPVMITGDHKNTAIAIAKETGIFEEGDEVILGSELDTMSQKSLERRLINVSVFARVSPAHKLKIVHLYKKRGDVVAMTGDGVNDAPAVKMADIGIAMGKNGTDVTKEAATIILLDDKFSSIVAAVIEGRIVYNNIRKAIMYLLACNVGEVVAMFIGMLMGFGPILLPMQILWVNLVTDGLPAIGLACDIPDRDKIITKKHYNNENILKDGLTRVIITRGLIMGILTLVAYAYGFYITKSEESARTSAFLCMVFFQLVFAFECRGYSGKIFRFSIPVILSFILAMVVLFVPIFRNAFSLTLPVRQEWLVIIGMTVVTPFVFAILKKWRSLWAKKRR